MLPSSLSPGIYFGPDLAYRPDIAYIQKRSMYGDKKPYTLPSKEMRPLKLMLLEFAEDEVEEIL